MKQLFKQTYRKARLAANECTNLIDTETTVIATMANACLFDRNYCTKAIAAKDRVALYRSYGIPLVVKTVTREDIASTLTAFLRRN